MVSEKVLRQLDEMDKNLVDPYKSVRKANAKIEINDEIYDGNRKMYKAGKKKAGSKRTGLGGVAAIVSLILAAISGWLIWYTATMG